MIRKIRIKNFLTLNDVTLRLEEHFGNRMAVLVGPNGSGKSNVFRALRSLEEGTEMAKQNGLPPPEVSVLYANGKSETLHKMPKSWGCMQWKRQTPSNAVKISNLSNQGEHICEEVMDTQLNGAAQLLIELRAEESPHNNSQEMSRKERLLHERFTKITGWTYEICAAHQQVSSPSDTQRYTFKFSSPSYDASTETIDTGSLTMFLCLFNLYCFDVVMLDDVDRNFHPGWTRLLLSCLRYEKNKSIILISHTLDAVNFSPSQCLTAVRKHNFKTKLTSFKDVSRKHSEMVNLLSVGQVMSIFFAECALIVEGKNDAILMSEIQNLALVDPRVNAHEEFFKASIIPTGGSSSVPTCVHLCSLLGVPCKVILDLDELLKEEDRMRDEDDEDEQEHRGGNHGHQKSFDPQTLKYADMVWKDNSAGSKVLDYYSATIPRKQLPHKLRAAKIHNNIWRWETREMYYEVVEVLLKYSSAGVFLWSNGAIEGFLYSVWPEWNVEKKIPIHLFKSLWWRNFTEEARTRFFELALQRDNNQFKRLLMFLNTKFPVVHVHEPRDKSPKRSRSRSKSRGRRED